jgi:Spectrin repeat
MCVFFQSFKEDLQNRENQLKSVLKTGAELKSKASAADAETIGRQLEEMNTSWTKVVRMSDRRTSRLEEALKDVIISIFSFKSIA